MRKKKSGFLLARSGVTWEKWQAEEGLSTHPSPLQISRFASSEQTNETLFCSRKVAEGFPDMWWLPVNLGRTDTLLSEDVLVRFNEDYRYHLQAYELSFPPPPHILPHRSHKFESTYEYVTLPLVQYYLLWLAASPQALMLCSFTNQTDGLARSTNWQDQLIKYHHSVTGRG